MERQLLILLVEDEPSECEALAEEIAEHPELRLAGMTGDQQEAVKMVEDFLPDVIILDLLLEYGSGAGLSFLRELRRSPLPVQPYIMITTNNASAATSDVARDLGADFIMSKHQRDYSPGLVVDHLLTSRGTILRRSAEKGVRQTPAARRNQLAVHIAEELDKVGISHKMLGRRYLEIGIRIMILEPEKQRLCAAIAKEVRKTETSVERAIKNAIDKAWSFGDLEPLNHYTARVDPENGGPTTTEFVCYYRDKLKREYGY